MDAHEINLSSQQRWAVRHVLLLSICISGCCLDSSQCSQIDTTHSCCVKKHPTDPQICDGIEGAEGATFRSTAITSQSAASSGQRAAVASIAVTATAGAATVLITMNDSAQVKKLQAELDKMVEECADKAEQIVDSRRPKDEVLNQARCNEVVEMSPDAKPLTRAMQLGNEKHREAFRCIDEGFNKIIPGHFCIEQRYRYDMKTGKLEPVSAEEEQRLIREGRQHELKGTLKPDVVIHSGDPTQARFIYDFKFPCIKDTLLTWRAYSRGPYQDSTQGQMYQKAFGVRPGRVGPGRKGVIR